MGESSTIMVVDDEPAVLKLLNRTLTAEGYRVIEADNGASALIQLEEQRPDLVILDIMMPGLNGFQVLNRIRQRSFVPVIMLTGKEGAATLQDAFSLGADDYVQKPFRPLELLARIRVKLRYARQEEALPLERG